MLQMQGRQLDRQIEGEREIKREREREGVERQRGREKERMKWKEIERERQGKRERQREKAIMLYVDRENAVDRQIARYIDRQIDLQIDKQIHREILNKQSFTQCTIIYLVQIQTFKFVLLDIHLFWDTPVSL